MLMIYEEAQLKLPTAVVEFRPAFHEYAFNRFVPADQLQGLTGFRVKCIFDFKQKYKNRQIYNSLNMACRCAF